MDANYYNHNITNFDDLEFFGHPHDEPGKKVFARIRYDNGYKVSLVKFEFYNFPYENDGIDRWNMIITDPNDVEYQTHTRLVDSEVNNKLIEIKNL